MDRGTSPKPGVFELAKLYYRPHAWVYCSAVLLGSMLAFITTASWLFWPLMVWTILFLIHFLVAKSLDVDNDWVAARTQDTAMKAFDISHIQTIRESYKKSSSRFKNKDPGEDPGKDKT